MSQADTVFAVLRDARLWVEHAVAPLRGLSSVACAPGDALLKRIDAALAAPTAKGGTEVPEGWKLVPENPTREMIHHMRYGSADALKIGIDESPVGGVTVFPNFGPELARYRYQAALAVAPPPPAGAAGGGSGDLGALIDAAKDAAYQCRERALMRDELSKGTLRAAADVIDALSNRLISAPTPDLGAQGEPVAWAWEQLTCGYWRREIQFGKPPEAPWRRNIRPLYEAPAAPRTGSGVSVEEIDKLCDRLDRLNTISEPQVCADVMDEARLMILALFAQAPRDGGETQGGFDAIGQRAREMCAEICTDANGDPVSEPCEVCTAHKEHDWRRDARADLLPTPPSGASPIRQDSEGATDA